MPVIRRTADPLRGIAVAAEQVAKPPSHRRLAAASASSRVRTQARASSELRQKVAPDLARSTANDRKRTMQYPDQHTDLGVKTHSKFIDFRSFDEESYSMGLEAPWQELHKHLFVEPGQSYEQYRAAYRTGYEGAQRYSASLKPDELASRLEQDYARLCDQHSIGWEHGCAAALAAYARAAETVWI